MQLFTFPLLHFRIVKMIATSGCLTALECTKFDSGWDPAGGAWSAPPDPLAGLRRPTSKGRGGKGRGGEKERNGKEIRRERRGKGEKGKEW